MIPGPWFYVISSMRFHLRFLFLIPFLSLASCSEKKPESASKSTPVSVDVIIATEESVSNPFECNGSVLAGESVELHAEASGRLILLNMTDGGSVRKGDLLAKVNDAEWQAQLRQQLTQLDLAKKNKARFEKMISINGVNQADYDNAMSQVAALEAAVDITKALIEKSEVRAPFDGRLGLRTVSPGAYVTPQTVLGSIQENGPVKIDFNLPEQILSHVKIGSEITVKGSDGVSRTATIRALDAQINPQTRNVKARAVLKQGTLTPGGYVNVFLDDPMRGILVPTQCVIPDATGNKVLRVQDGKGVFVPVKTGSRNDKVVEIQDGLQPGDSIVVVGVLFVRPNSPVTVRSVKAVSL